MSVLLSLHERHTLFQLSWKWEVARIQSMEGIAVVAANCYSGGN